MTERLNYKSAGVKRIMVECPSCEGKGNHGGTIGGAPNPMRSESCDFCGGRGQVSKKSEDEYYGTHKNPGQKWTGASMTEPTPAPLNKREVAISALSEAIKEANPSQPPKVIAKMTLEAIDKLLPIEATDMTEISQTGPGADNVVHQAESNPPANTETTPTGADMVADDHLNTASPKWNMAADCIIAAFNKMADAAVLTKKGKKEQAAANRKTALHLLISAMEAPGIQELMFSLNQVNTAAVLPMEMDQDLGIDPEMDAEDFGWLDDEDEGDDEAADNPDNYQSNGDDLDHDADDSTLSSLNLQDENRAKIALANRLSMSGRPEDRRIAQSLLEGK